MKAPSMDLIERRFRERGWTLEEAIFTPTGKCRFDHARGHLPSVDLTGRDVGEWHVLRFHGRDSVGRAFWWARCSCGVEGRVQHSNLLSGRSVSCGHARGSLVKRRANRATQRKEVAA